MSYHVPLQVEPSSTRSQRYTSERLWQMGKQAEMLLSYYSSLETYKRSIERQLALMAAQIHEEDVLLSPRSVFLLVEIRGSGGLSARLEQIAHILGEVGYWKPVVSGNNYRGRDVYQLGKSAQRLFDDYALLDRRVKQLYRRLQYIKEQRHMELETSPQEVFAALATASEGMPVREGIDAVADLLEQPGHPGWLKRLFVHRGSKKS